MRISRESMFLEMAKVAARRSTCYRLSVGAVVVQDRNVLSIGYNGAPAGEPHCAGNACPHFRPTGCTVTHAERNAFDRLPPVYADRGPLELYVTHSPCIGCASNVVGFGVARVFYEVEYRDRSPLDYLIKHGVEVYRLSPSGFKLNVVTGELVE